MQKFHTLIEHLSRGLSVRFAHNPAIKWSLILFVLIIFTGNFGFFIQNAWYFSVGFSVFFALCYRKMQESYNNFLEAHDFLLKIFEKYSHLQNDKVDIYKDSLKLFEIEKKLQKNAIFGKNIAIEGIFELQKFIFEKFSQNQKHNFGGYYAVRPCLMLKAQFRPPKFLTIAIKPAIIFFIWTVVAVWYEEKMELMQLLTFLPFCVIGAYGLALICSFIYHIFTHTYRENNIAHAITRISNSTLILYIIKSSNQGNISISTEKILKILEILSEEIVHILKNKKLEDRLQERSLRDWEYLKKFSQKNSIELIQILEENLQKNILKEQKILQKSIEDIDSINTKLPVLELQKKRLEMQMQKFQNLTF